MAQNIWTREQTIVALNLYWKIPYNQISGTSNLLIRDVAPLLGKTSGALAFKLMNLSSLDDERQNKGKLNSSRLDKEIWLEFHKNWELLAQENARILAAIKGVTLESEWPAGGDSFIGLEATRTVQGRINQHEFRSRVLASYGSRCCITGISQPELLIASHIVPWAKDKEQRLNPKNGLCLNGLHDKAFDRGFFTVTQDFKVRVSKKLLVNGDWGQDFFGKYNGLTIHLPQRFQPGLEFLQYHSETVFQG